MSPRHLRALLLAAILSAAVGVGAAQAATTRNLVGTSWDFTCGGLCGPQTHTFDTQDANGNLTGHGSGGSVTWSITGNVNGDQFTMTVTYTGGGYTATATGTINAATTQITGTFTDSAGHNLPFQMKRLSAAADPGPIYPAVPGPAPVVGKTANARAVSGTVLVEAPGSKTFVALADPQQIRVGSVIDARKGRVRISIANGTGGVDTADFYQGIFRFTQSATGTKFATLTLVGGSFKGCPRAPKAQLSGKPSRSVRHLWGAGTGRFRTVGRFSSASLRGTIWLTEDKCNATLTRVTKGAVSVRDFVRRKAVLVKAGHSYLARARR